MNRKHVPAGSLLAVLLVAIVPRLSGQTAPAPAVAPEPTAEEETVVLSPFVVEASEDAGSYRATSSLAGTRVRTELKDIGSAISVITPQFLQDTQARNSEDLLVYTTSTEIGGLQGNYAGFGGSSPNETPMLLRPNNNNRVRGLGSADNTRDFFLTDIPWDSYIVGRVDLQRGPNSILFGLGKPAGIVNSSINAASFSDSGTIEARYGSFGSARVSLDINRVLIEDELSVRFAALLDKTYYRQDPAYNRDKRVYGAVRFDPGFLAKGSAHTSFRVNYEHGEIDANRPRSLPPTDQISNWFKTGTYTVALQGGGSRTYQNLNRSTYNMVDANNGRDSVPGSGARQSGDPDYQPFLNELYGGNYAFFPDPTSGVQEGPAWVSEPTRANFFALGSNGQRDGGVGGIPFARWSVPQGLRGWVDRVNAANARTIPFAGDYKNQSLTDTSIYNFYDKLIDGPNKFEVRGFDAVNAVVSQTFLNNRVGLELAYDHQDYEDSQDVIFEGGNYVITVDVNTVLPDGTANPNVGRPMIVSRSTFGSSGQQSSRNSVRLTGFGELRFEDFMEKSTLTSILGRHVFTGLASKDRYDRDNRAWSRFAMSEGFGPYAGLGEGFDPVREMMVISYLGGDLRAVNSPSGLNLTNVKAYQRPGSTAIRFFDGHWNKPVNPATTGYVDPGAAWTNPFNNLASTESENPANYIGWTNFGSTVLSSVDGDRRVLTRQARLDRDKIESKALIWQGYFWDGNIVGTYGWRNDEAKAYGRAANTTPSGFADTLASDYVLPNLPSNTVSGDTTSWSVVLHTPQFIREKLPFGTNLSLSYNQSENFEPAAGRVDLLNVPIAPPTGQTKDYGFTVSALDERLSFKVIWYETTAKNASSGVSNLWVVGSTESRAWVGAKRFQAGLSQADPNVGPYSGADYNYGTTVGGVFTQTAADRALQQQHVTAVLNAFEPQIWQAWNMFPTDSKWQGGSPAWDPWGNGLPGNAPAGLTGTTDTSSEGIEFELFFQPVKNWNIAMNAAKTEATRTNIAGSLREYIDSRALIWNDEAGGGGLRAFSGETGSPTIKSRDWTSNFYSQYSLQRLLEGTNVGELRPWRFNVTTNYSFTGERFRGFNVGGSYRWEDKVVIGYPSAVIPGIGESYDITRTFDGPSESTVDLWVGYERKLNEKLKWRTQLNVRNALGNNELVPISFQPDGAPAGFRIREGLTWSLSNSLTF